MGYYTDLWKKQKEAKSLLTLSNANTAAKKGSGANTVSGASANLGAGKTNTSKGSGANVVSSASANLGAGKATGGTSNKSFGGNKSSGGNKNSTAAAIYTTLLNNPPIVAPKVTYVTPTTTPAKTINTVAQDIATEAYKKRLAANQRRTTNQGMYNDEERIAKEKGSGANLVAMQSANLGANDIRNYEEIPPVIPPYIPPAAPVQEVIPEEELLEEEEWEEEELDPMEEYLQAILDKQNAQSQALINALMGQSGSLNAQYDANAANMYEMYRRGQLAFPELMSGTATGLADSFSLQNNLNFQNNLSDNELARAAALDALQVQANQVQADAELQAAQTAADWAKMMYQQRLANQNKGSSGGSSSNGGSTAQETVTTQPVAPMSTSQALLAAKQYASSFKQQTAYLQQLLANGQITPEQYSDLMMALDPQYSYK